MNDATEILKLILDLGPDATTAVIVFAVAWVIKELIPAIVFLILFILVGRGLKWMAVNKKGFFE